MLKSGIALAVPVFVLGVSTCVSAQHEHGASQPEASYASTSSDAGIEQVEQIHKLTAKLAVLNETLRSSEDPRELRQGIEEQGRITGERSTRLLPLRSS